MWTAARGQLRVRYGRCKLRRRITGYRIATGRHLGHGCFLAMAVLNHSHSNLDRFSMMQHSVGALSKKTILGMVRIVNHMQRGSDEAVTTRWRASKLFLAAVGSSDCLDYRLQDQKLGSICVLRKRTTLTSCGRDWTSFVTASTVGPATGTCCSSA